MILHLHWRVNHSLSVVVLSLKGIVFFVAGTDCLGGVVGPKCDCLREQRVILQSGNVLLGFLNLFIMFDHVIFFRNDFRLWIIWCKWYHFILSSIIIIYGNFIISLWVFMKILIANCIVSLKQQIQNCKYNIKWFTLPT